MNTAPSENDVDIKAEKIIKLPNSAVDGVKIAKRVILGDIPTNAIDASRKPLDKGISSIVAVGMAELPGCSKDRPTTKMLESEICKNTAPSDNDVDIRAEKRIKLHNSAVDGVKNAKRVILGDIPTNAIDASRKPLDKGTSSIVSVGMAELPCCSKDRPITKMLESEICKNTAPSENDVDIRAEKMIKLTNSAVDGVKNANRVILGDIPTNAIDASRKPLDKGTSSIVSVGMAELPGCSKDRPTTKMLESEICKNTAPSKNDVDIKAEIFSDRKEAMAKALQKTVNNQKQGLSPTGGNKAEPAAADVDLAPAVAADVQLPADVMNIDAFEGGNNTLFVTEYVRDIYSYLYSLETTYPIRPNHLDGQAEVTPDLRAKVICFLSDLQQVDNYSIDTFLQAVAVFDRYLQAVQDTKYAQLELVALTAYSLAAKYEERKVTKIGFFADTIKTVFSKNELSAMEVQMFKQLDFHLARPLPIHFLRRYSRAAKGTIVSHAMAKYFVELSSVEYGMAAYKPSEMAAASALLAIHMVADDALVPSGFNGKHWTSTLQHYSGYAADQLRPIVRKIAALVFDAPKALLTSVYKKYQMADNISLRKELYGELMRSLAASGGSDHI